MSRQCCIHIAHHQFQQPEQDSHQRNAKHPNFGRQRKLVKCPHMLLTVNYEFYAIPKPGQPKQPARIAEKQPEVPCRRDLRPTPPTVISFPSSCSHLRRITDIESVATIGGVRSTYRTMQASCIPRCLHCAIFRPAVLPLGTRAPRRSVHSFL